MVKKEGICISCKRQMKIHGKGRCNTCYKKAFWKPKIAVCKRCKRMRPHHSKGYCNGCYNTTFHLENTKNHNYRRYHNIPPELYHKITSHCIICKFSKVVELHHRDGNHKNNSPKNMIGLCPNHHKMAHILQFKEEVLTQIQEALAEKEPLLPREEREDPNKPCVNLPILIK